MENALRGIVSCNQQYKESVGTKPGSGWMDLHEKLKAEMAHVVELHKFKRTGESQIVFENQSAGEKLRATRQKLAEFSRSMDEHSQQLVRRILLQNLSVILFRRKRIDI